MTHGGSVQTQGLPEGTVTVLFSDVVVSTDLTVRRKDQAAQDLLRAQRELVRHARGLAFQAAEVVTP